MSIDRLYSLFLDSNGVATDTRKVSKGEIFFALKGPNFNGNSFAVNAIEEHGAIASIVDEKINHPNCIYVDDVLSTLQNLSKHHRLQFKIPILALTGSNGKTTTKELIKAVLDTTFQTHATVGNLNNQIGIPLTLLSMKKGTEIGVIEMGANHKGEIASYCEYTMPTHGLITNIGLAHLEGFGGPEGVMLGKSELYKYLTANSGTLFINADDEVLVDLAKNYPNIQTFGAKENTTIQGNIQQSTTGFLEFDWSCKSEVSVRQSTHLVGNYNFSNAMYAILIGIYFNIEVQKIEDAIKSYIPENNRSQSKRIGKNTFILDAYNANPSSMKEALISLSNQIASEKWAVLGGMKEMGEFEEDVHIEIADLAKNLQLNTILIGPEFLKASSVYSFKHFMTSDEAGSWLKNNLPSDACILLKGSRGTALEKILPYLD